MSYRSVSDTAQSTLKDKVAIVTSGNSAIGKATALQFAREGANVLITGQDRERLEAVSEQDPAIEYIANDATVPSELQRIVQQAHDRWGPVDILVNNAGVDGSASVGGRSVNAAQKVYATNILGSTLLIRDILADLRDRHGAIVNVTSAATRRTSTKPSSQRSSKAALEGVTKYWALELAPEARVNTIAPGPIHTPTPAQKSSERSDEQLSQVNGRDQETIPLGRRGDPGEVTDWIVRLAAPQAAWITGQVLFIDGGHSLI